MHKAAKGAIAVAAGAVLLMGGAGTLAYWQDSATIDAATVTTGELDVSVGDGCEWTVAHKGAESKPLESTSGFRMVPGDTVTCTVAFTTTAVGDNLKADAKIDWMGHQALPAGMTSTATGTYDEAPIDTTTFAVQSGSTDGELVFSLAWDFDAAPAQGGMDKAIDLSAATVTVVQK